MITNIFQGGLGNQLFQVAAGLSFARDNNDSYVLNPATFLGMGQGRSIYHYLDTVFKNIDKGCFTCSNVYKEKTFAYNSIPYSGDMLLDGYFQSPKYFGKQSSFIKNAFCFPQVGFQRKTCAIHVRLGDYMNSGFSLITPKYFADSIEYVRSREESIDFIVMTDSPQHVHNYLPTDLNYRFFENDELGQIAAMMASDYAIISNSTFGWWGSFLGKDKISIAPDKWGTERWFKDSSEYADIYRSDMIRIAV